MGAGASVDGIDIFLSSQPANQSNELSTGITEAIARTIEKIIPGTEIIIGELNHVVRKMRIFCIYGAWHIDDERAGAVGQTGRRAFCWP